MGLPVLRSAISAWALCVEDVGRAVLIPALPRPPTQIQDLVLEELKRRLESVAKAWVSVLSEPALSLKTMVAESATSIQQIREALRAVELGTSDLKDLATSARAMRTAAKTMADSSHDFQGAAQQLGGVSETFGGKLTDLARAVEASGNRSNAVAAALDQGRDELGRRSAELHTSILKMSEKFGDLADVVRDRMVQEAKVAEDAAEAVEQLRTATAHTQATLEAVSSNAHDMNLAISMLTSTAQQTFGTLNERISEELKQTLGDWQHEQQMLMQPLARQLERVTAALVASETALSGELQSATQALRSVLREVELGAKQVAARETTVAQSFEKFAEQIPEQLKENLGQWQREQQMLMQPLARRLERETESLGALQTAFQASLEAMLRMGLGTGDRD